MKRQLAFTLALLLTVALPSQLGAEIQITIPAGTPIYGELEDLVTSRKKATTTGDIVRARVWRNVVVGGHTVLEAGAPMVLKVSRVLRASAGGQKGILELEAVSARGVDGNEIQLDGGYDKSGQGRKMASVMLLAAGVLPLIFLRGEQAELPAGTVFDGVVQEDTVFTVEEQEDTEPTEGNGSGGVPNLEIEPLYDEMDESSKNPNMPVRLRLCNGGELTSASVVTVNEGDIEPIPVALSAVTQEGDCSTTRGQVDLKAVGQHFAKGINRFEIEAGGEKAEIVLDVEL